MNIHISFSIYNGKWKINTNFSFKMKNEKWLFIFHFHFPFKMENGNNGMYTDHRASIRHWFRQRNRDAVRFHQFRKTGFTFTNGLCRFT